MEPSSLWHQDWQNEGHVRLFDSRSRMTDRALIGHYDSFNDVRMLGEILPRNSTARLMEVGCATGEFYRYLRLRHPSVRYCGVDVSRAALERARQKYPKGLFLLHSPEKLLTETLQASGRPERSDVVYSKDVVHHQTDPFGFLGQLLEHASEAVVLRLRTRDSGQTVLDPGLSCQYHYDGWMPYLVLNTQELTDFLQGRCPQAEITLSRNYRVLGGRENRFLPKECYLPETGTAETSIALLKKTSNPGRLRVENRRDMNWTHDWKSRIKRILTGGPV